MNRRRPSAPAAPTHGDDCRCLCGSLLARLVEGAVELKCRRCKRTLRVPLAGADRGQPGALQPVEVIPARHAG